MLQLRPNCEHCATALPPESLEARICSYECTFCRACADGVLANVCPNCGGGFVERPIRPARAWRDGVSRAHQRPSSERVHKPVDVTAHRRFAAPIAKLTPHLR